MNSEEPTTELRATGVYFGHGGQTSSFLPFVSPKHFQTHLEIEGLPTMVHCPLLLIGAGPNSAFIQRFRSFVITSSSESWDAQLVLEPHNPLDYAGNDGNQFLYAPFVRNPIMERSSRHKFWWLNTRIHIGDFEDPSTATHEGFEPCMLSLDGEDDRRIQVTQAFTSKFVEIARGLQIDIERDIITGKLIIDNIDDDTLALFPNLEYIVEGDNGMAVHIGTLQPHEYTTREENQQNKVTVLLNDDPSICFLNSGIFKGLALHFDMAHNRLGFADSF